MSKKDWLKKLDLSKVEDVEFEDITEQKSDSVNETKTEEATSPKTDAWTQEKESKLKSLLEEVSQKTNRLKELEEAIKKISPREGTLEIKSFESSFVDKEFKEMVNDLFKSKKLGEVYECSVTGRGDYLIFRLDTKTKGIFSSRKRIESEVTSRDGELIIKNHSLIGNGKSKKTDFFRKELENFLEKIKTDIQNQETNYIDEVKIEKGILQVKFGLGKETTDPDEKNLEELEQEKQTIELLLKEKNKSKDVLLDEKWRTLNDASEEDKKEFNIQESIKIPLIAKIEGRIWKCQNEEELRILSEKLREEGDKLDKEEKKRWEDVLPILNLSKEEMIGILSLWKDWANSDTNPELKKWSQDCIDTLGKVMNDIPEEEKINKPVLAEEGESDDVKESSTNVSNETIVPDENDIEVIENNKRLDNEEIDQKIKNLDKESALYDIQVENLEKERREVNDYYDSRLKTLNQKEETNDNEYIPIKYDTEKYDISIISMEGLKNKIEENLREKLEIRRIITKEVTINSVDDSFNLLVELEEDSAGRKKILAEFNLTNEKDKISIEEVEHGKNGKLASVLIKEVKSEIRKAINELRKNAEKKEGKESKAIRIKGESFEIIFEK